MLNAQELFLIWKDGFLHTNVEIWDKVASPFAEYSFSCAGRLSQLWQSSSSVSHRWPVIHSVCNSPENQKSSESFAKHVPLSHPSAVFLSDYRYFSEGSWLSFIVSLGDGQTILASSRTHADARTHTQLCRPVKLCDMRGINSPAHKYDSEVQRKLVKRDTDVAQNVCSARCTLTYNARCNFTVGDTLIMSALSSITASQTGNQVVVSMSSLLISTH